MREILCYALAVYYVILILRIILSWVTMFWSPPSSLSPAVRVIYELTEPVLSVFRRAIPPIGGFDFSPIIVFLLLGIVQGQIGCGVLI